MFGISAAPSWPSTVDDVYITLTYARRWAETGDLSWTTGERVEGYSNFLFMALLAAGARLGLDIDVLAQLVAFVCAAAILVWAERRLPRTPAGTLAAFALAAWAPLGHWGTIGMETTLYSLLLCVGWAGVLGRPQRAGHAVLALGAATLVRPEGLLHFVVALPVVAAGLRDRRGAWGAAAGTAAALGAYHLARITWFGDAVPTPYLVKIAPVGASIHGIPQLAAELTTALGIGVTLLGAGRVPLRVLGLCLLPLGLQAATLIRASGDWMAWGRIVLPGVVASAAAFLESARWQPPGRAAPTAVTAFVVAWCSVLEPRGYATFSLTVRSPTSLLRLPGHLRHGLDTPVAEDVAWVVDHVPLDARGLVVDAGILGDIPGFRLIDMRGLTHRPAAEAIAAGREESWLRSAIASEDRPEFLRLAHWEGETHPEYPSWLIGPYARVADLRYGGGSIRWYATTDRQPSAEERVARWDEMLRRHPSQPFLWWHAALSASADGDTHRSARLAEEAASRWPSMAEFTDAPASLTVTEGTRALSWVHARGLELRCGDRMVSRPIPAGQLITFHLDARDTTAGLLVEDPCSAGEPATPTTTDSSCPTPRRVSVTVDCKPSAEGPVFLRAAVEPSTGAGGG